MARCSGTMRAANLSPVAIASGTMTPSTFAALACHSSRSLGRSQTYDVSRSGSGLVSACGKQSPLYVAAPKPISRRATRMPMIAPATTSMRSASRMKKNTDVAACGTTMNSIKTAINTSMDNP